VARLGRSCASSHACCICALMETHGRRFAGENADLIRPTVFVRRTKTNKIPSTGALAPALEVPDPMTSPDYRIPDCPNCPPDSFWVRLTEAQQHAFVEAATQRIFAAGATLMEEGETGDHVAVILVGRTKICIWEGGGEQVIAKRGPGELIGERAALRVSVRSASVVALEQVKALVMTTEAFASYLGRFPEVLQIVEDQIYDRLTRDLGRRHRGHLQHAWEVGRTIVPRFGRSTPVRLAGENCTVVFTDVAAFGSPIRNDEHRRTIQRELLRMTYDALQTIWNQCYLAERGDGHLLVAPPSVPTVQVLRALFITLPDALRRHNLLYGAGAQIQLRVALDVGPVTGDEAVVSGQVIINAARYVEAPLLKQRMAETNATVGFVISDFVFQNAVSLAECPTDPVGYSPIEVCVKELKKQAWMYLVHPTQALPGNTVLPLVS
jgi:CRP-like cAMP-binding protein